MTRKVTDLDSLVLVAEGLLQRGGKRRFLAIAGAPGSGKSTVVEALLARLDVIYPDKTAILPMDGFHYDDALLQQMNRLPWKGAPDTFDVGGLRSVLKRLSDPDEGAVAVPVFDRALEISRGSARLIAPEKQLILVEGNYLLLKSDPWSQLAESYDQTIMIDVSEAELQRRLRQRWVGFDLSEKEILHKLEGNDLPNGRTVRSNSMQADFIYCQ